MNRSTPVKSHPFSYYNDVVVSHVAAGRPRPEVSATRGQASATSGRGRAAKPRLIAAPCPRAGSTISISERYAVVLRTLGGYALGATAFVACPCHLPLTLPLVLAVLAGTSAGAWLTANPQLVVLGATMYFVVGIVGAAWLLGRRAAVRAGVRSQEISGADGCCAPVPPGLWDSPAKPRSSSNRD